MRRTYFFIDKPDVTLLPVVSLSISHACAILIYISFLRKYYIVKAFRKESRLEGRD